MTPTKAQRIRRREDVIFQAQRQNKTKKKNTARDAKTLSRFFCGCERKQERGEQEEVRWGGLGGMTRARQTGRRAEEGGKWREKEGKREQERAPLPSLNLSCSDQ